VIGPQKPQIITNHTFFQEALLLKELAQEVRRNATDVIEAVHKASEEFSNVMNQTKDALKQITILQVI
jgi:hypothetical protein